MNRLFSLDNPFMQFLSKVCDLLILNDLYFKLHSFHYDRSLSGGPQFDFLKACAPRGSVHCQRLFQGICVKF